MPGNYLVGDAVFYYQLDCDDTSHFFRDKHYGILHEHRDDGWHVHSKMGVGFGVFSLR
jgi:hypothetical protein